MLRLPMHDIYLPMDIGGHECLEVCLAGIGPNGEVHILSYKQTQFIEQALVVSEPPATDQFLNLPRRGHRATRDARGRNKIPPIPIMWPTTLICRSLPWGRYSVPPFASVRYL